MGTYLQNKSFPSFKKGHFRPPPSLQKKVVGMGIFPQCVSLYSLALQLDRSSAVTKVTGSIPGEYIEFELFVVNSQWGRICKKNIPIF